MAVTIKIRRGTTAEWNASQRILLQGELGLDTTLNKIKAGNGINLWPQLPYITADAAEITEISQDAVAAAMIEFLSIDSNIQVVYDDAQNIIGLDVGPNVVLTDSLNNTLGDYVPIGDVDQPDGVAALDANGNLRIPGLKVIHDALEYILPLESGTLALQSDAGTISTGEQPPADPKNGDMWYDSAIGKTFIFYDAYWVEVPGSSTNIGPAGPKGADGAQGLPGEAQPYVAGFGIAINGLTLSVDATDLAAVTYVDSSVSTGVSTGITNHNNDTTDVHGISDTSLLATKSYADNAASTAVASVVGTAPASLNTLGELASAIGNNATYSTSVTSALNLKAPLASPTFTGIPLAPTAPNGTNNTQIATTAFVANYSSSYSLPDATPQTGGKVFGLQDTADNNYLYGIDSFATNTGTDNLAMGSSPLFSNTSGSNNVAFGSNTLYSNITGSGNIGIGPNTLSFIEAGTGNVAIGALTSLSRTVGFNNIAIGSGAMSLADSGSSNIAIGTGVLDGVLGSNNTAIGSGNTANGSNNITLGHGALTTSTTVSNEIVIGNAQNNRFMVPGLEIDWNSDTSPGTAWKAYTPVVTADGGGFSLGNGVISGRYKQIGKTVFFYAKLVYGSTTTPGAGHWNFSLPVQAYNSNFTFSASILDDGVTWYGGIGNGNYTGSTTSVVVLTPSPNAATTAWVPVGNGGPFTWGNADNITVSGSYEAA